MAFAEGSSISPVLRRARSWVMSNTSRPRSILTLMPYNEPARIGSRAGANGKPRRCGRFE